MSESLTTPSEDSEPIQTPIRGIQDNNTNEILGSDSTVTYTTPYDSRPCYCFFLLLTAFSLVLILIIVLAIINSEIRFLFGALFLIVFASIFLMGVGGCDPLSISIIVDKSQGIVFIKKKKIINLCNTKTIHFSEIQEVIIRKDYGVSNMDDSPVKAFELIFKLIDKREIKPIYGFSGIVHDNNEIDKVYSILRNSLPPNIPFSGDLVNN